MRVDFSLLPAAGPWVVSFTATHPTHVSRIGCARVSSLPHRAALMLSTALHVTDVLLGSRASGHCHHCFTDLAGDTPIQCGGCGFERYCSMRCRAACAAVHTIECAAVKQLMGPLASAMDSPFAALFSAFSALGSGDKDAQRLVIRIVAKWVCEH